MSANEDLGLCPSYNIICTALSASYSYTLSYISSLTQTAQFLYPKVAEESIIFAAVTN